MEEAKIGYIRVSSIDQHTERQLADLQLDKVFEDKSSAQNANRPQLQACLEYCREGDTLFIHSIDRLARNLRDLLRLIEFLNLVSCLAERFFSEHFEDEFVYILVPVIKTKLAFFQMEVKSVFCQAPKAYQASFGKSPEALYAVNV